MNRSKNNEDRSHGDIEALERLIGRWLDGEITEEEQLELDRAVIRDPDGRRLRDEHQRIHAAARAALEPFAKAGAADVDAIVAAGARQRSPRSSINRFWVFLPGAIAAALLGLLMSGIGVPGDRTARNGMQAIRGPGRSVSGQRPTAVPSLVPQTPQPYDEIMRNVGTATRAHRRTGREVIGVRGRSGNLYWIEVDRVRTVRRPVVVDSLGDM